MVVVVVAVVQLPLCWPCSSNPKMSRKSWTLLDRLLVVEPERRLGANGVQEADFSIGSTHTEGLYIYSIFSMLSLDYVFNWGYMQSTCFHRNLIVVGEF